MVGRSGAPSYLAIANKKCNVVKKLSIMSVGVADVVYDELERDIADAIRERKQLVVLYASAHILNLAYKRADLHDALSAATIVHADGVGVWLVSKLLNGKGFRERFNWTDHAHEFLEKCAQCHWSIFFLGSTKEVLTKAVERINREIPSLKIVGMRNGFDDVDSDDLIRTINGAKPDVLWVAMGAPKQELWIYRHADELDCPFIQSVGDAISLIAGVKRRGPKFLQRLGLEWFVRLFFNPKKFFTRYVIGIPLFAARVVRQKLR